MTEEKVTSLVYKNIQYNVDDVVEIKTIDGITNPPGTIVISGLAPPDTVLLRELGTSWFGSCSIDEIKVIGKLEADIEPIPGDTGVVTRIVTKTSEPGLGMSYLAHTVTKGSSICGRCGRSLTAPRSVNCGYGPHCFRVLFDRAQPPTEEEKLRRSARVSRRTLKIDYSKMTDARELFE